MLSVFEGVRAITLLNYSMTCKEYGNTLTDAGLARIYSVSSWAILCTTMYSYVFTRDAPEFSAMCLMCAELYVNHRRNMEHQRVAGKGNAFDCCTEEILHTQAQAIHMEYMENTQVYA